MQSREDNFQLLGAAFQQQEDPDVTVKLAMITNEIDEANYQATVEAAIKLFRMIKSNMRMNGAPTVKW